MKDHLGNVRLVFSDQKDVNIGTTTRYRYNLDVRAVNNYYPFGMLMPEMSWQTSGYRFGYGSHENDNDVKGEGNHSSFGDYGYDPRVGRRLMLEPKRDLFNSQSPYSTFLDNPIAYSDPDGRLVIFINGWCSEGNCGISSYWSGYDKKLLAHIGDPNSYYIDGSLGGIKTTFEDFESLANLFYPMNGNINFNLFYNNLSMNKRIEEGKEKGIEDAFRIFNTLQGDETIKIVTHSMGAAYSRGYVEGLFSQVDEWNQLFPDRKIKPKQLIETQLDLSPFQGALLPNFNINIKNKFYKSNAWGSDFPGGPLFNDVNAKKLYTPFFKTHSVSTFDVIGVPKSNKNAPKRYFDSPLAPDPRRLKDEKDD